MSILTHFQSTISVLVSITPSKFLFLRKVDWLRLRQCPIEHRIRFQKLSPSHLLGVLDMNHCSSLSNPIQKLWHFCCNNFEILLTMNARASTTAERLSNKVKLTNISNDGQRIFGNKNPFWIYFEGGCGRVDNVAHDPNAR